MITLGRVFGLLLVAFYLVLAVGVTFDLADFSWTPSYFDDDDDDFLQNLLSDHTPMLSVPPVVWFPLLGASFAAVCLRTSALSLVAPSRSRLRAPPLL
jgi:hypothetical protein